MATTYTTNYNLGKQENHADKFDMDVITDNADKIDAALTGLQSGIDGKQATLTTDQLAAVNSGITAEKLAQDENNISSLTPDIKRVVAFSGGTTYSMVSDCTLTLVVDDIAPVYRISGFLGQGSAGIRGIILSKSNNSADFDTEANVLCKAEQSSGTRSTLACDDIWFNSTDNPRYVYCWVKLATSGTGRVYTIAERLG